MSKVKKLPKQKKLPKRLQAIRANIEPLKLYPLGEALNIVKENATAKFDETVDLALNLGVDTKHADQQVRVVVPLPHGTGKTVRIAVFARGAKADEAKEAGADIIGAEDLVDAIKAGNINFDRAIATPDMMGIVGSVAKILGPKGMMPNPKLGSVTMNVGDAVRQAKAGQVEVRAEKAGIVHAGFGKASFSLEALEENLKTLVSAIMKARPTGAKGTYLKSAVVTTTQGLACKVDVATII